MNERTSALQNIKWWLPSSWISITGHFLYTVYIVLHVFGYSILILLYSVDISKVGQYHQQLTVYNGNNIILQCGVQLTGPTRWHYANSPRTNQMIIYNGNSVVTKYVQGVSVDAEQNLSLNNVKINESGCYTCVKAGISYSIKFDVYG